MSADDAVLLAAPNISFHSTNRHSKKETPKANTKKRNTMEKLTLHEVHILRKAQRDLNHCKAICLEFYPKLAKHAYTTELNNLIRGDFSRVDVELKIPKLPAKNNQEEYTSMIQVDKMLDLYGAICDVKSLL